MNSATRLITILEELKNTGKYSTMMNNLFECDDKYEQYMIAQYFIKDVKNIKVLLKQKGKYKDFVDDELRQILDLVSPFYYDYAIVGNSRQHKIENTIRTLNNWDMLLDNEQLHNANIEELKLKLKGIEKTDTFLDDIIGDIDEALKYYGFFGEIILDDKFNQAFSTFFVKQEKIIELINQNKAIKTVNIILSFFDTYEKIKQAPQKVLTIVEDVKKLLKNDDKTIDAQIED